MDSSLDDLVTQQSLEEDIATRARCTFVFMICIFLANLLVAQLTHTYHDAHANMKAQLLRDLAVSTSMVKSPSKGFASQQFD